MALVATLAEFKAWLKYPTANTNDDSKMTDVLTGASEWVEWRIGGPLAVTSFTERHICNGWAITPNKRPLVAVASITPDLGTALDPSWYVADTTVNQVRFYWGIRRCHVTMVYTAGLATTTYRVKTAGLELARHLWLVQNGSSGRGHPGEETATPMGFAVPNRVDEMLAPSAVGGFA